MTFITDFADQAIVLPLALAIAICLLAQGWWRGAGVWILVIGATLAIILSLKLVFLACSRVFAPAGIRTPSGHAAAATIMAGGVATLLLRQRGVVLPVAATGFLVIGTTRFVLGAHSLPEIVVGGLVGLVGTVTLLWLTEPPPKHVNRCSIGVIVLVVLLVFHGMHLPAEGRIRSGSRYLAQMLGFCQAYQTRL